MLQTVLVVTGASVLAETEVPPLLTRLGRLASYFTIQSNLLVAVTAVQLARDPSRDGRWWRPVRVAAVVGITVTGLVHFVLLRPLLDLEGASRARRHAAPPGRAGAGGRRVARSPARVRGPLARRAPALVWPVAWLVWTLAVGGVTGWYPYPFLDVGAEGAAAVAVTCVGVTAALRRPRRRLSALDRRMPAAPGPRAAPDPAHRRHGRMTGCPPRPMPSSTPRSPRA